MEKLGFMLGRWVEWSCDLVIFGLCIGVVLVGFFGYISYTFVQADCGDFGLTPRWDEKLFRSAVKLD